MTPKDRPMLTPAALELNKKRLPLG
jgi:hypothetical protein